MKAEADSSQKAKTGWLNRTVLGIGLASLLSDWSHEIATAAMPAFLASLGAAAVWLGLIEGISDGLSSFAKMGSGYYTDRLQRRKPIAVVGYVVTALGTAALGLAANAWWVLAARASAWLGRGVRTPVRKALLAGSMERAAYGRAFGLERMMDTIGAIIGPATALLILRASNHNYRLLFLSTIIPGLLAAAVVAFLVKERKRAPVPHISFGKHLQLLPATYRRFLVAVGLFGAGDFAHTFLILLATEKLASRMGLAAAASFAVSLYILHNVFYAGFSFIAGWLADRVRKNRLLVVGYALAGAMALAIVLLPLTLATFILIFIMGGVYVAIEETVEDAFCAELVSERQHGMAFGALATVNGVGDLVSSVIVGVLWSTLGTTTAFAYSAALFLVGATLVARLPDAVAPSGRGRG